MTKEELLQTIRVTYIAADEYGFKETADGLRAVFAALKYGNEKELHAYLGIFAGHRCWIETKKMKAAEEKLEKLEKLLAEEEEFDINRWSYQWEKNVRDFAARHNLPARVRNPMWRVGTLRNGRSVFFNRKGDGQEPPYPEFREVIHDIANGTFPIGQLGEKRQEWIKDALLREVVERTLREEEE